MKEVAAIPACEGGRWVRLVRQATATNTQGQPGRRMQWGTGAVGQRGRSTWLGHTIDVQAYAKIEADGWQHDRNATEPASGLRTHPPPEARRHASWMA